MADYQERKKETLRCYLERRKASGIKERTSFITHWKDLSEFIKPRRGRFYTQDRNRGDKWTYNKIINSAGTRAHRIAQAGMLAGTMSPSRPWFKLETPDPDLMERVSVTTWLARVELLLQSVLKESNFYSMASTMLGELLQFGTGALAHVDDYEDVARFYAYTAGSYWIGQDDRFVVNTFGREFEMTVGQIVPMFGLDNVSVAVKNCWDRSDYDEWIPVVHVVEPNPEYDPKLSMSPGRGKAFRSVYYEPGADKDKDKVLRNKGFEDFPVYVPRWEVTGEDIYATDCPGMTALGDIKQLQMLERRKAQAIDKLVNPPLKGPATLRNIPVNSLPGGLTTYDGDSAKEGLAPIYQVAPDVAAITQEIAAVERRINNVFFVDLFMAITNMEGIQPRNELDLRQRDAERLLQLGPVLERLESEFLNRVIDRVFNQCARAGVLPQPIPEELSNSVLRVKYISTLAMAQRSVATSAIERVAGFVGGLAGSGWMEAPDKFDADQAVDEYAKVVGVPPSVIVPDDVVAQRRQKRNQQQQMAAMAQTAETGAKAAKALGDVKTGESNMMADMMKATQK